MISLNKKKICSSSLICSLNCFTIANNCDAWIYSSSFLPSANCFDMEYFCKMSTMGYYQWHFFFINQICDLWMKYWLVHNVNSYAAHPTVRSVEVEPPVELVWGLSSRPLCFPWTSLHPEPLEDKRAMMDWQYDTGSVPCYFQDSGRCPLAHPPETPPQDSKFIGPNRIVVSIRFGTPLHVDVTIKSPYMLTKLRYSWPQTGIKPVTPLLASLSTSAPPTTPHSAWRPTTCSLMKGGPPPGIKWAGRTSSSRATPGLVRLGRGQRLRVTHPSPLPSSRLPQLYSPSL